MFDRFFLCSNSFEGFVSYMESNFTPLGNYRVFIIKGGPGTGKSTFMKSVAKRAMLDNFKVSLCPCSSDPDSVDGVIIEEIGAILLDGTPPHTVEPKYFGVSEEIINLGEFLDTKKLKDRKNEIISLYNINKTFHKTAGFYLASAKKSKAALLNAEREYLLEEKVLRFADKTAEDLIPKTTPAHSPLDLVRLIEGITPKGIVSYPQTVTNGYDNICLIGKNNGNISDIIIKRIKQRAHENGFDTITLKNPFLPKTLDSHLLIPKLNTAIVTEDTHIKFDTSAKRINTRRFFDPSIKKYYRQRSRINSKLTENLLSGGVLSLGRAKTVHDLLEDFYINAMDFKGFEALADKTYKKILGN